LPALATAARSPYLAVVACRTAHGARGAMTLRVSDNGTVRETSPGNDAATAVGATMTTVDPEDEEKNVSP
jgi:hypothetical protein